MANKDTVNADMMPKKKVSSVNNTSKNTGKKKKKSAKAKRKQRKIAIVVVEVVLLIAVIIGLIIYNIYGKIAADDIDKEDLGINADLDTDLLKGYTNIALFGLDNSGGMNYETGNSDAILIASIDNDTKEVRIVSVYRDTYLSVGNGKYYKANYAYMHGGVSQSVAMLNTNLDLDIEDYICVNWVALTKVIDAIGGIDIEVTLEEAQHLNECIFEIDNLTGYATDGVTGGGMTHLNGTQATAYARIRAMAGDDFMRASRQRIVLQAMVDKIKESDPVTLVSVANSVLNDVKTSLSIGEIAALATKVREYSVVGTTAFPMELTTGSTSAGDSIIALELDNNVAALHKYLFGEEDYQVSKAVQKISDAIVEETGCSYDSQDAYNLDQWLEKSDPEWEKNHSTEETTEKQ